VDLSRAGATLRSASEEVQKVKQGPAVVVLEIGGNDLLSRRTAVDFEKDLRALLEKLRNPERTLVIFELPLPPFYNAYGRIQRSLAGQFRAVLIPKRLFCKVLARHGSTVDGIHLSAKGQIEMAAVVRDVLGRAVPASP
jgi:acyl-CoA thioesterase-1